MSLRYWLIVSAVLFLVLGGGYYFLTPPAGEEAKFSKATVHLSPDCGCCRSHARYLSQAGVDVEVFEHGRAHLSKMKDQMGIPGSYQSCHTTEVEDWVIEGHVPLEVINSVVEREPDAKVISLPGMPAGSPGMPGSKTGEWTFYTISGGEVTGEFTTR